MVVDIGSRRELLVDEELIETSRDVRLQLQRPERRETAITLDAPWEDCVAFPDSVVPWDGGWRLYYRAGILDWAREEDTYVAAVATSTDGLTFARPELPGCAFAGSDRNNILQIGGFPRVPPPFVDTNPACLPTQRLKGIAGRALQAYAMVSADGLRWSLLSDQPLALPGHFDTVNTAFWDRVAGLYRCYTRSWHDRDTGRVLSGWDFGGAVGIRAIQHATSTDFVHWSAPQQLEYADGDRATQLYTNAIVPCPGAEHVYLGFPNRYVPDRRIDPKHEYEGANDALFMSSRDGVRWHRWLDAWVTPGLDPLNWTERNNYPVWGIATTSPTEWSLYVSEHYRHRGLPTRVRRLAVRPWGFVAAHADHRGGELLTRPFTFAGSVLRLNARTSAAGSIRVEVQDEQGRPLPGCGLDGAPPWFGDGLEAPAPLGAGADLRAVVGRPVRLRFVLQEADLFAFQFGAA